MATESKRERIIQHVLAELISGSPPRTDVLRCPLSAIPESMTTAIVLIGPGDESASDDDGESTQNDVTLEIGCVLKEVPATGHTVDQDCDSMLVWVHQKLMADRTQGGLALETRYVGTSWILEPNYDIDLVGAKATYRITHSVSLEDPTA